MLGGPVRYAEKRGARPCGLSPSWALERRRSAHSRTATCGAWAWRQARNAWKTPASSPRRWKHSTWATSPGRRSWGRTISRRTSPARWESRVFPPRAFEAACASGGSAFFHAYSSVAAGLYDVVLVTGVEKMTSQPTPRVSEILAGAGDLAGEIKAGATFAALFAMIARRHMHQYGTTQGTDGRRGGQEPRQRFQEPVCAHAQADHAGAGARRQAHRRAADHLRLLAHQ